MNSHSFASITWIALPSYLGQQLNLPADTGFQETKHYRSRYRQLIRSYLAVTAYSEGGAWLVEQAARQAAYTMSDPADLLNVAIEHLIAQRFELPAFSALDRLVRYGTTYMRTSMLV